MKKKLLSRFLMAVMIMNVFFCNAIAKSNDIVIDISNPVNNPSNLATSGGFVNFAGKDQYVEYEVDAEKSGSYYINFKRANVGAGNFYIYAEVNGETVNRRTGRITNSDGSFTFQDEVQLDEGKNIIKIGNMTNYEGNVSYLSLTETDTVQYTTSMNTFSGGRSFKAAYKSGLGVDPWLWINDSVNTYPEGDTAPYITFEVKILKSGFYYPAIATSGANKVKLSVADNVYYVNDSCTVLPDKYKASGSATCSWLKCNEPMYMNEGTYDVTISLYGANAAKWNTYIGAARFIKMVESNPTDETVYYGDFALDVTQPARCANADETDDGLSMEGGGWSEYDLNVAENASYYVNFKRKDNENGKNFYIQVSANGQTVNRRTGRTDNADGISTFQSEIQLKKGKNTVRVENMSSNSGTLSYLSFTKLENLQFTTSMNSASGRRTFKKAYKTGVIGVDPWLYIDEPISEYSPGNLPFVTFDAQIMYDGFYYPEIAKGSSGLYYKMYIDGQSIDFNSNTEKLNEQFMSSSFVSCKWIRSNNVVYLSSGIHEITLAIVGGVNQNQTSWRLSLGAVRFTEAIDQHLTFMVEGEDANVYYSDENAENKSEEISIYESDASAKLSGGALLSVCTSMGNAPVTVSVDAVITNESDYYLDILGAYDNKRHSKGTLSVMSSDGEIISDIEINDENFSVVMPSYAKFSGLGGAELSIIRLNQAIHLPKGKNTINVKFDEISENDTIDFILDAFELTEAVDTSNVTAYISQNKVCVGNRIKVKFENGMGMPIYTEKFGFVNFSSSDEMVAAVNSHGEIKGVRPGNAVITVNADGNIFNLHVSTTSDNGLVINSAFLNSDGNIEIVYSADRFSKFDIVAANYNTKDGLKTSLRGLVIKSVVCDDENERTIIIDNTEFSTDLGTLYELYFWDCEDSMNSVYQKIQLK